MQLAASADGKANAAFARSPCGKRLVVLSAEVPQTSNRFVIWIIRPGDLVRLHPKTAA